MIDTHGRITVVVGGQFGSEGKGAVAGWVGRSSANEGRPVVGVRVGGPNAGHTVYGRCPRRMGDEVGAHPSCNKCNEFGHPWALRQVPVLAVTNEDALLVIAAGSEVDPSVLADELDSLEAAGYDVRRRLVVDRSATLLMESHRSAEAGKELQRRLGSTAKGIGAARADRIFREASTVGRPVEFDWDRWVNAHRGPDTWENMESALRRGGHVIIEGTQGFGLGLHTDFYPYTTSGDCRAIDFLAQAGLSPWVRPSGVWDLPPRLRVVVCFRPYPIRVAGNSGPLADETSWEELQLPQELTTVTQKVRRVGAWDPALVERAVAANGGFGPHLVMALTMADHIVPDLAGHTAAMSGAASNLLYDWVQKSGFSPAAVHHFWDGLQKGCSILGTGPTTMLGDILNEPPGPEVF